MRISVFRRAHFNAAHRIYNPKWSDEENRRVFGPCAHTNFHGHNYELVVKITGEVNPDTGYVMDINKLKQIIKTEIEDRFDHKNLNLDVPEMQGLIPTAEHICFTIWKILRAHIDEKLDLSVRLYETPRNFVEYPA